MRSEVFVKSVALHCPRVLLLHNRVAEGATVGGEGAEAQVRAVTEALEQIGFAPKLIGIEWDLGEIQRAIQEHTPTLAFNLVGSLQGHGRLIHVVSSVLDALGLPYTGVPSDAIFQTSYRTLAKTLLQAKGIRTPAWLEIPLHDPTRIAFDPPYIVKPVWEDASKGLNEGCIVRERTLLRKVMLERASLGGNCFAEAFIEGRKFRVSLLGDASGVEVLPVAELRLEQNEETRSFEISLPDKELVRELSRIATKCWKLFRLRGYASVDFRVDSQGEPYVLEVKANPCISPDSEFVAAATKAKISYNKLVGRIIADCPMKF